jgi:pimeloyl-ACP methyl ester carboxylesterase
MQQDLESAIESEPVRREYLPVGRGDNLRKIAVRRRSGGTPGLLWLGGLKSDMRGTKAVALDRWAAAHGRSCVRFDYSGHGESEGEFAEGTVSRWLEESIAVFDACCDGPQVLVGSSMGAWLALLLTRELRRREPPHGPLSPAAVVLIAPAVDFTEQLMWKRFPASVKRKLASEGVWQRPSLYSPEPYPITAALIEDGRRHLLLGGLIETGCPVRILQGVADPDVPWRHAVDLVSRLAQDDVVLSLIKDGDHRLSRPEDVERLIGVVSEFCRDGGAETS